VCVSVQLVCVALFFTAFCSYIFFRICIYYMYQYIRLYVLSIIARAFKKTPFCDRVRFLCSCIRLSLINIIHVISGKVYKQLNSFFSRDLSFLLLTFFYTRFYLPFFILVVI